MNTDILFGKTTEHLVALEGTKYSINKEMIHDYLQLKKNAEEAGFDLQIASAFRDYDRQLKIWNSKARGERPILDNQSVPLDYSKLSPTELMFSILRWSAVPGCSRHHWGTDIDVYDGNTQKADHVKLIPSECEGHGPAAKLHEWLDGQIEQNLALGFYRPYRTDRGGISPEKWHLSYAPMATRYERFFTTSLFKKNILEGEVLLKDELLENLDEVFQRFFINLDPP